MGCRPLNVQLLVIPIPENAQKRLGHSLRLPFNAALSLSPISGARLFFVLQGPRNIRGKEEKFDIVGLP